MENDLLIIYPAQQSLFFTHNKPYFTNQLMYGKTEWSVLQATYPFDLFNILRFFFFNTTATGRRPSSCFPVQQVDLHEENQSSTNYSKDSILDISTIR